MAAWLRSHPIAAHHISSPSISLCATTHIKQSIPRPRRQTLGCPEYATIEGNEDFPTLLRLESCDDGFRNLVGFDEGRKEGDEGRGGSERCEERCADVSGENESRADQRGGIPWGNCSDWKMKERGETDL